MKYCKTCLNTDTRPNGYLTEDGICPACKYFNELKNVDWDERYSQLEDLIKKYPRGKDQFFDCIIGVSGGKDSMRQALWARDKLKLNPLLVSFSYPPEQVSQRGVDNLSNLISLGFDTLVISSEPQTWKKVLREGFFRFSNWAKASELALLSSVPKIAIRYKIPLVLWGENPGLQLGDMKSLGRNGYDGNNLRNLNTLAGGNYKWLVEAGLNKYNLISFLYPTPKEFDYSNIQIIYLGWFWNNWSIMRNAKYALTSGLKIRDDIVEDTGDITSVNALDEDWVSLNQMIKYYKYGFGRVSDYVNEAIRYKDITRDEGIKLLEKYDGSCGEKYIQDFCKYIDITLEEFWSHVRKSVNKDLFYIDLNGQIKRKFKVGVGL